MSTKRYLSDFWWRMTLFVYGTYARETERSGAVFLG